MLFGYTLPTRGPMATPETIAGLTIAAERLGFDSVWASDHIVIPTDITSDYPYAQPGVAASGGAAFPADDYPYLEPLTTLTYLAGMTERIKLGTNVLIVPYRNPVYAAKTIATLDYLSGGRVILGVGTGWMEEEFNVLGQPHFAERGALTNEYLRLFVELWTNDNPSFTGEYYQVDGIKFSPKPVQKPHPPIWVGGHSNPAIRRAATLGDGWLPMGIPGVTPLGPDEMRVKVDWLRELAAKEGRDPAQIKVCMAVRAGPMNERIPDRLFSGPPEAMAEDIHRYQEAGVEYFVMNLGRGEVSEITESMEKFMREAVPLVTG
jgi:probable F420-dependent oxidoreductase